MCALLNNVKNRLHVWVQVLHSDGSPWCSLPDLLKPRRAHTQSGLTSCGGQNSTGAYSEIWADCETFSGGSWAPSHTLQVQTNLQGRGGHLAWSSPDGVVLLGGWFDAQNTTELLSDTTGDSTTHFPLKHPVM